MVYLPTHGEGYLVRTKGTVPDIIVVDEKLSDQKIENVIFHEFGHYKHDKDVIGNYENDVRARDCSENNADCYMISKKVKEYIDLGYDAITANYVNLADSLGTQNYWKVKEELEKYKVDN